LPENTKADCVVGALQFEDPPSAQQPMSKVDQFESVFRAALKEPFEFKPLKINRAMLVTDLLVHEADRLAESVKTFIEAATGASVPTWAVVAGEEYANTVELLGRVEEEKPDLIIAYRNLKSEAWKFPHSLGEFLDVLLQLTSSPVLVIPHPDAGYAAEHSLSSCNKVLAMTDHLANDYRLVSAAATFTEKGGNLTLSHIEDQTVFDRYMEAISKIPQIDTDEARELLANQLRKGPADYIDSCRTVLSELKLDIEIHAQIEFGSNLAEYKNILENEPIDLLVMRTKDNDQLAMHGQAYPLAVEMRAIPLLMI